MRRLIAVAAALFLADCATAGHQSSERQPSSFQSKADQAPEWSDGEIVDYITELAETQLSEICGEMQTLRTQRECLREAVYRGFDTTGNARRNCDEKRKLDDFVRCVILGTMLHDLIAQARPEAIKDFDWNAPDAKLEGVAKGLGQSLADACLEGDLSAVDRCYLESVSKMFALTASQTAACSGMARIDDAADCMLRVYFVQRFETAIRRMGPGEGRTV